MFGGSLAKTVRPHLAAGEELSGAVIASLPGAGAAMMARGAGSNVVGSHFDTRAGDAQSAAEAAGVRLAHRMIVALTSRRLIVFRSGGAFKPNVAELLTEIPVVDIDAIDVHAGKLSKTVTVTTQGLRFQIETARAQPAESLALSAALARAAV